MTYHIDVNEISMTKNEKTELLELRHSTWTTTGNLSEDSDVRVAREAYFSVDGMDIIEFTVVKGGLRTTRHPLQVRNCSYRVVAGILQWWPPLKGGMGRVRGLECMWTCSPDRNTKRGIWGPVDCSYQNPGPCGKGTCSEYTHSIRGDPHRPVVEVHPTPIRGAKGPNVRVGESGIKKEPHCGALSFFVIFTT